MRKLRRAGAAEQEGNVVTIPRLPSVTEAKINDPVSLLLAIVLVDLLLTPASVAGSRIAALLVRGVASGLPACIFGFQEITFQGIGQIQPFDEVLRAAVQVQFRPARLRRPFLDINCRSNPSTFYYCTVFLAVIDAEKIDPLRRTAR